MPTRLFEKAPALVDVPKEGDLYKRISVFGKTFEIRYGYYEDFERQYNDPMPIYPDFLKEPMHTDNGKPFVTQMQDACLHYSGTAISDRDCGGCAHYLQGDGFLGLCECPQNRIQPQESVVNL